MSIKICILLRLLKHKKTVCNEINNKTIKFIYIIIGFLFITILNFNYFFCFVYVLKLNVCIIFFVY